MARYQWAPDCLVEWRAGQKKLADVRPSSGEGNEVRARLDRYGKLLGEARSNLARGLQGVGFELANSSDRATNLTRQLVLSQIERLAPPLQPSTE
jgi:hypothetical protein